jgi:DNA helicase HerA-like ATPase
MTREYLKIVPSRESLRPDTAIQQLESLRHLISDSGSWNPLSSATNPTFEFLIYSSGENEPVEFYIGVDPSNHLGSLEDHLHTLYPDSFSISRVDFSITEALYQELEDHVALESANPDSNDDSLPVKKDDSIDLDAYRGARTPHIIQWLGTEKRRQDWMTTLQRFSNREELEDIDQSHRSPLSSLIEVLSKSEYPAGYQVLWTPREDWSSKAKQRKTRIQMEADTIPQAIRSATADFISRTSDDSPNEEERTHHRGRNPNHVGSTIENEQTPAGDIAQRRALIDLKRPSRTFTVNIRGVVLPTEKHKDGRESPDSVINRLQNSISNLNGEYYGLTPTRLDRGVKEHLGESSDYISTNSQQALQKMENRELESSSRFSKRKAQLVMNADELANFATVPSADALTREGERGTRGRPEVDDPLPTPDPDRLNDYAGSGMAIGYPLGEDRAPLENPIELTPSHLIKHVIRLASTGGGKSIAIINDVLTAHDQIPGPVVVMDPKGDGLSEEYMRAHFKIYRSLDDVYYFSVPETLPAFSFFDIRPQLARGEDRSKAVQRVVFQFKEILRMVMGTSNFEQARTSIKVIEQLIKALFDETYGSDAFGITELEDAAVEMLTEERIPEVSDKNRDIERKLARHFDGDQTTFTRIVNGAINRLDEVTSNDYLKQILDHTPKWDDQTQSYAEPTFDFRHFLEEDVVLLFDTGKLRPEAQQALKLLFLSNYWDAAELRRTSEGQRPDNITNMIIEEAAPIASSDLVANELIPQGRSFGVSIELVMQYGEQVALETEGKSGERGYREILNNVHTKLIGNIDLDEDLAKTLENERLSADEWGQRMRALGPGEWIADLVAPGFGKRSPEPFNLAPLPIPPGHSEADDTLHPDLESNFKEELVPKTKARTAEELGVEPLNSTSSNDTIPQFHGDSGSTGQSSGGSTSQAPSAGSDSTAAATASGGGESSSTSQTPDAGNDRPDASASSMQAGLAELDEDMGDADTPSTESETAVSDGAGVDDYDSSGDTPMGKVDLYDNGLPEHIEIDSEADVYRCTLCGSTYLGGERSSATSCCTFETPQELLDAAGDLFAHSEAESPYEFAGTLLEHAQNQDVDIAFGDLTAELEPTDDDATSESSTSNEQDGVPPETFKEAVVDLSDDALEENNLTREEAKFLGVIIDAVNDAVEGYSLLDSMTELRDGFEELDVKKLVDDNLLEENRVIRQRYYTPTPAARDLLEKPLKAAPYEGDLGEKTPHKVGVELLRRWFESKDAVERAEKYYPVGDDEVIDAVGLDSEGKIVYAGEVELDSNNPDSLVRDYQQLESLDAKTVWVFRNTVEAGEITKTLSDREDLGILVTSKETRSIPALREVVESVDPDGLSTIRSFTELKEEVIES